MEPKELLKIYSEFLNLMPHLNKNAEYGEDYLIFEYAKCFSLSELVENEVFINRLKERLEILKSKHVR